MPGQTWIYVFFTLMGCCFALGSLVVAVPEVERLWALGRLPLFAGVPLDGGAVYRGVLQGAAEITPLGGPAVAWIGVVTQTVRQGKGTYTAEKCRLGHLTDLRLEGDGRRWSIQTRDLNDISLKLGFSASRGSQTRYLLGPTEAVSPVPDDIIARCRIDRGDLARGHWQYAEQAAAPGSSAEFAGCADAEVLSACRTPGSVAAGHLSATGMRAMVRRMADSTMGMVTLLVVLMALFTAFGAIVSVLALRAAAPIEVLRPQERT